MIKNKEIVSISNNPTMEWLKKIVKRYSCCYVINNEGKFIGAGTIVAKDIPDNSVCLGNPMRIIGT